MIFKIIICLIIILSTSSLGYLISLRYSLRIQQINYFLSSLKVLETEIIYYSTPLPLALKKISLRSHKSISDIFNHAGEILSSKEGFKIEEAWKKAVDKNKRFTSFTKEDIDVICDFGKELGLGSKETQKNHFKFITTLLKEQKNKAISEKNTNGSMFNKLGVLIGIGIVIIFI